MKISILKAKNVNDGLLMLKDIKLNGSTSFKVFQLSSKISSILENAQKVQTQLLDEKYGIKNEVDNTYTIKESMIEDYNKEMIDLYDTVEEILFEPFKVSDFANIEISFQFFILMQDLIVE